MGILGGAATPESSSRLAVRVEFDDYPIGGVDDIHVIRKLSGLVEQPRLIGDVQRAVRPDRHGLRAAEFARFAW